jgi:uncharacterized 2Fe-2S/4Fe-4S cluster protein (DUF4445 family)
MDYNITVTGNAMKRDLHLTGVRNLLDVFIDAGLEIPVLCNKNGSCGKCRVVVKAAANPVHEVERLSLGETLLGRGYRLACKTEIMGEGEVFIPVESRESACFGNELDIIKSESSSWTDRFSALSSHSLISSSDEQFVAVDIGTTTLTGYLFDRGGNLLSHCSCFNPTTLFGADVITRLTYIQSEDDGFLRVRQNLLKGVKRLINTLCFRAEGIDGKGDADNLFEKIAGMAVCGNTIMQCIFMGKNPVETGLYPYNPLIKELVRTKAGAASIASVSVDFSEIGLADNTELIIAPSVSGFIGGDAVCGTLAVRLHAPCEPWMLIDLGTNGEMVLSCRGRLYAASASAGPAFEGYMIGVGMRATIGAIDSVTLDSGGEVSYTVIGGGRPKGICGSGVISAIDALLCAGALSSKGHILPLGDNGRIVRNSFTIAAKEDTGSADPISITDKDVEVIQQAKASFAAGISCLLRSAGLRAQDLTKLYLAGAFGSRVDGGSLKRIGLIPPGVDADIVPLGNAAGIGLAMLLLREGVAEEAEQVAGTIETVGLASLAEFEDEFVNALFFKTDVHA